MHLWILQDEYRPCISQAILQCVSKHSSTIILPQANSEQQSLCSVDCKFWLFPIFRFSHDASRPLTHRRICSRVNTLSPVEYRKHCLWRPQWLPNRDMCKWSFTYILIILGLQNTSQEDGSTDAKESEQSHDLFNMVYHVLAKFIINTILVRIDNCIGFHGNHQFSSFIPFSQISNERYDWFMIELINFMIIFTHKFVSSPHWLAIIHVSAKPYER